MKHVSTASESSWLSLGLAGGANSDVFLEGLSTAAPSTANVGEVSVMANELLDSQ